MVEGIVMENMKKNFWELKINTRERRELLLVTLLLTVSMILLNSSFNRVAEKTVIKISKMTIENQIRG